MIRGVNKVDKLNDIDKLLLIYLNFNIKMTMILNTNIRNRNN